MAQEKKYIPELRFPEFKNDGGWILETIGTIADTFSGGTPTVGNREYYGGDIPFIRSGEISNDKTELFITESGLSNSSAKMVDKGTILYAMYGATSGEVAISKISGAINQAILAIIPRKQEYNSRYIYHYLKHNKQYILSKYLQGGQGNLSANIINNLPIYLPCDSEGKVSIKEQQKIADCLSSLDEYINVAKQKVDQLKEHKKGLMQRLFPAEGKTVPELRFHEFMEKEWEIDKFSNVFTCIPNNTLSRADLNYSGGRVKNIHYGDILTRFRECLDVRRSRLPFISENNDVERYFMSLLKNGDLIIADTAEDEIVGKCAELQGISDEFVVAGLHTIAIRPNNKFANCYLAFYMNSSAYRKQLTPLMQGVKVLSISRSAISKTEIYFPSSILEQEKIAKCLDSLENLIESYERKIEVLNIQKKGLMQQVFPQL